MRAMNVDWPLGEGGTSVLGGGEGGGGNGTRPDHIIGSTRVWGDGDGEGGMIPIFFRSLFEAQRRDLVVTLHWLVPHIIFFATTLQWFLCNTL